MYRQKASRTGKTAEVLRVILEAYDLQVCLGLTAQQWSHFVCYWNFNISWYYVLLIASFFVSVSIETLLVIVLMVFCRRKRSQILMMLLLLSLHRVPTPSAARTSLNWVQRISEAFMLLFGLTCFQFRISSKTHAHSHTEHFYVSGWQQTSENVLTHLKKWFVEINDLLLTC